VKRERGISMAVRQADFAGSWYPGSEHECRRAIETLSGSAVPCGGKEDVLVGGIVPHAGWLYSGRIACNVIKCLSGREGADTCLIFGRHLHPGARNFIMKAGGWATPLGALDIDGDVAEKLAAEFPFQVETAARYEEDNTIELQLPFIRFFFPGIRIVPIGLPPSPASLKIAQRAAEISEGMGRKTIVIGSTDLTHYGHNYAFAPKGTGPEAVEWVKKENDKRIVDLMARMDAEGVISDAAGNHNACCAGAAASAIVAAKVLGARSAETLVYSTSYDVRPDSSFVGYVGIVFKK
jgi:AmmeMemoRadiSam system protein B